jgi:hypothetical protein
MDNGFLKSSWARLCLLILAAVPMLALATAGTAFARFQAVLAEGGTTDIFGDTGHIVIGGIIDTTGTTAVTVRSLNLTIAYQDNFIGEASPLNSFICTLTNPTDLVISGGPPVQAMSLTISATGDTCFQTLFPTVTFITNVGKSLTFRAYTLGSQTRFKSTGSTLVDHSGDVVGNVAIEGSFEPAGAGSPQATGTRLMTAFGGAVDTDDSAHPSGHMAMAGTITLNPLKKGVTTGTAKALDATIDFEDFAFLKHLLCHLIIPGEVSYTLVKGVGTLTLTVGSASECTGVDNTGKKLVFALYVFGATGRIVSTSSTLLDTDLALITPAIAGEFSTAGGS